MPAPKPLRNRYFRGQKATKLGFVDAFGGYSGPFRPTRPVDRGTRKRRKPIIGPNHVLAFFFVRVGVFMTITMKNIRHLSQPPSQHTLQPSILWPQGTGWRRRRNLVSIGTVVTFMPQRVGNVNAATVDVLVQASF